MADFIRHGPGKGLILPRSVSKGNLESLAKGGQWQNLLEPSSEGGTGCANGRGSEDVTQRQEQVKGEHHEQRMERLKSRKYFLWVRLWPSPLEQKGWNPVTVAHVAC